MKSSSAKAGAANSFFSHIEIVDFDFSFKLISNDDKAMLISFILRMCNLFTIESLRDYKQTSTTHEQELKEIQKVLEEFFSSAKTIGYKKTAYLYCLYQCLQILEQNQAQSTAVIKLIFLWGNCYLTMPMQNSGSNMASCNQAEVSQRQYQAFESHIFFKILYRILSEFQQCLHHQNYLSAYEPKREEIQKYMEIVIGWIKNKDTVYLLQETYQQVIFNFHFLVVWRLQTEFSFLKQKFPKNAVSWLTEEAKKVNSILESTSFLGKPIDVSSLLKNFAANEATIHNLREKIVLLESLIQECHDPEKFLLLYTEGIPPNKKNTRKHQASEALNEIDKWIISKEGEDFRKANPAFAGECLRKYKVFSATVLEYDVRVAEEMIKGKVSLVAWEKENNLMQRFNLLQNKDDALGKRIQSISLFVAKQAKSELLAEESVEKTSMKQQKADKQKQKSLQAEESERQREQARQQRELKERAQQAQIQLQQEAQKKAEEERKQREKEQRIAELALLCEPKEEQQKSIEAKNLPNKKNKPSKTSSADTSRIDKMQAELQAAKMAMEKMQQALAAEKALAAQRAQELEEAKIIAQQKTQELEQLRAAAEESIPVPLPILETTYLVPVTAPNGAVGFLNVPADIVLLPAPLGYFPSQSQQQQNGPHKKCHWSTGSQ